MRNRKHVRPPSVSSPETLAVGAGGRDKTPMVDFAGLSELLGYRLRRAQGSVHRDFVATMGKLRITQKQAAVLWLVQSNPGVMQGAIGAALGMDRATMMTLVNRLEGRGVLKRRQSRIDARRRELHLTAAGVRLIGRVRERIKEHERRVRFCFRDDELRVLKSLLQRLQSLDT